MNASELRIGNYILDDNGKVDSVWSLGHNVEYMLNECFGESEAQPIPLTLEVLDACGFIEDYFIYKIPHEPLSHIERNGDKQTKDYGKWLWYNRYGDMEVSVGAPFQHLHQLQNLYFALTGKELPIDLDKLKQVVK